MHKIIKVSKSNQENIVVIEYKDLNLIALQVRSLKMQDNLILKSTERTY